MTKKAEFMKLTERGSSGTPVHASVQELSANHSLSGPPPLVVPDLQYAQVVKARQPGLEATPSQVEPEKHSKNPGFEYGLVDCQLLQQSEKLQANFAPYVIVFRLFWFIQFKKPRQTTNTTA